MEWWKIVLSIFCIVYVSLIIYQIVYHQTNKWKSSSPDKIKSAMVRADKEYENTKHEKRVKFVIDKHSDTKPVYEFVYEFIINFWKWILSILYYTENSIQTFIQWIIEYVVYTMYVVSRKIGIVGSNI